MSDQLQHLWIPDEEVEQLDKKAKSPIKDYGLDHSQHGAVLSSGLQNVMTAYSHLKDDSLSDEDLVIFKMVLPESEDIYTRQEIATKEGLKINAVKDKQHAVVSTNKKMFTRLQERVGKYRESGSLNYFQFVDKFEPLSIEDKQSKGLVLYLEENQDKLRIDIQVMLVPNLDPDVRDRAVERLESEIRKTNDQHYVNRYELSDGTPVIRADMPMKDVDRLSEDTAVFRVEQTSFFSPG